MKFKPGELIDEIIEGELQSRCLVLSHRKHPVVPGLTDYTIYVIWNGRSNRQHSPGETLILTNTIIESPHDDYYWRKNEA